MRSTWQPGWRPKPKQMAMPVRAVVRVDGVDRERGAAVCAVDGVEAAGQVKPHLGMRRRETAQARHEPACGEGRRRGYRQGAVLARVARSLDRRCETLQTFAHFRQDRLAFGGQRECPGQPMEELHAERVFQRLDLVAHRGRRDEELFRRLLEAAMACRRLEGAQPVQRQEAIDHMDEIVSPLT